MDNPQHYQPLSHALHPPASSSTQTHPNHYTNAGHHASYSQQQKATSNLQEEEEEEEEEEDDDDEGLVEEQLNHNDADAHGSDSSPRPSSSTVPQTSNNRTPQEEPTSPVPEQKRRPGRPRGSKNRRPRVGSAKHETTFYYQGQTPSQTASATPSVPPQHPNIGLQNQQYYEFQWRVLNLCAEFYGAAEELVKQTAPLVVAQCYQMGPGVKIDPLVMLGDAKRVCDTLLANPSQLVTNPPPPIYPTMQPLYQPVVAPQVTPVASTSTAGATPAASTSIAPTPANVITNPQSFVVPLGAQPAYPHPQYPIYAAPHGQYPTTPYYQYAPYPPGAYYAPQQSIANTSLPPVASTSMSTTQVQPTATITTTPATGGTVIGNQGAWSDEETERLKKLTEESRSKGPSGDIEWDWVIQEWGISRTRHQILIKATALGLKESSTRGTKRRRENEPGDVPVMASLQPSTSNTSTTSTAMVIPSTSSPSHSASQPASTPGASPAMQHQQRPASSKGPSALASSTTAASQLPWPMPTTAANIPSPVIAASTNPHPHEQQQQQRSSYYRPRPNQDAQTIPKQTTHQQQYNLYAPNGQSKNGK
ncbi:hypothetical protein GALMADRAFT_154888 [Galerina marginata CBS 339.88]|uniref:Myb-like domain-containing protein n=1 Tax=Galerina marginata (strain CBS 339.88) TaxID=685588 RepID=A0A067TJ82_GALM3|nr:hypothetical protein GALMADRAFT_154888 [Galerina marginata CBS 339.88]